MPAKSKAQQKLMAMALHAPEKIHEANRDVLGMKASSLREFAETGTKGLPSHAHKTMHSESYSYNWRSRRNLKRGR